MSFLNKNIFHFSVLVVGLLGFQSVNAQTVELPYNPDSNADQFISTPDLLEFLPNFDSAFEADQLQVDGMPLEQYLNELAAGVTMVGVELLSDTVLAFTFSNDSVISIPFPEAITGPQGPGGLQGDQGEQGIQGVAGLDGTNGSNGVDGATGPQGAIGPQGDQGNTGGVGANGSDGLGAFGLWLLMGNEGSEDDFLASLHGAEGETGQQGDQGVQGAAGSEGAAGSNGLDGETGSQGQQGANGVPGQDGLNCWDQNQNGLNESFEDVNGDGLWSVADCVLITGPPQVLESSPFGLIYTPHDAHTFLLDSFFVIPQGVNQIEFVVAGGVGGNGGSTVGPYNENSNGCIYGSDNGGTGGAGGSLRGLLNVTWGDTVSFNVGTNGLNGSTPIFWNANGTSGSAGTESVLYLGSEPVITCTGGGGGGGAICYAGGDNGTPGSPGGSGGILYSSLFNQSGIVVLEAGGVSGAQIRIRH